MSYQCYEILKNNNLIKNYNRWEEKHQGGMDGLTLFKKDKNGKEKKVFVKRYGRGRGLSLMCNELLDYSIFTILHQCGAGAPIVKLKGTDTKNEVFLFSYDAKHNKPNYSIEELYYHDLNNAPYQLEYEKQNIHLNQSVFASLMPQKSDYPSIKSNLQEL